MTWLDRRAALFGLGETRPKRDAKVTQEPKETYGDGVHRPDLPAAVSREVGRDRDRRNLLCCVADWRNLLCWVLAGWAVLVGGPGAGTGADGSGPT